MIRLLVVDDHAVVREGVKRILAAAPDIVVTGEAEQAQEMYDALATHAFDMVLLDVSLPGPNGLDLLKHVHTIYPDLPVLIFSVHPERQYVVRALRDGAAGYLLKNSVPRELVSAIQQVAQGERYISAALITHLMHEVAKTDHSVQATLTTREDQVLRLLAAGYAMKEIAYTLGVSIKTVSTYRARMLEKLCLHSTADLIRYALQHGLVE
jgi:DNA-binding NarL/FixJ family response regulator